MKSTNYHKIQQKNRNFVLFRLNTSEFAASLNLKPTENNVSQSSQGTYNKTKEVSMFCKYGNIYHFQVKII